VLLSPRPRRGEGGGRGMKIKISIPYSLILEQRTKNKEQSIDNVEEENYLIPLSQPSPRLGRGLKSFQQLTVT